MGNGTVKKPWYKRFWLMSLLIFSLIGLIGVGSGSFYIGSVIKEIPAWNSKVMKVNMNTFIYDRNGNIVAELRADQNRIPINIEQVPQVVIDAFLATEDIRFYEHKGVDLKAIFRAAWVNLQGGTIHEGASTISQQYIKLTFLSPEQTLKRKIKEAYLAMTLEKKFTKNEILELYLNRIYFGNGAYGIEAAAETYFGKTVDQLNLEEAAFLAGVPKNPSKYTPYQNPEESWARRNVVLSQMRKYALITKSEEQQAKEEPLRVIPPKQAAYVFPYYVDYVIQEAKERNLLGGEDVTNGGYHIYTNLDPGMQKILEDTFKDPRNFPPGTKDRQVEGAMAVLDYRTGEVKALVGGRQHTAVMGFNRATQLSRQPGSSIKPIAVYGPALENGLSAATSIDDAPLKIGKFRPENSDGSYRGPITMRPAITNSVNIYAVKLLQKLGVDKGFAFSQQVGLPLTDKDRGWGLALGGLEGGVSPLEMASAMGTFGNEGAWIQPRAINRVTDSTGKLIWQANPVRHIVMKRENAYILTDLLREVVKTGTGHRARLNRPTAGKTGTTQLPNLPAFRRLKGNKDAWFVGYTPELAAAVWMGYDKTDPQHFLKKTFGGDHPAMMWRKVMDKILKGQPVKEFVKPPGLVRARICSVSGGLARKSCPSEWELFTPSTKPQKYCRLSHWSQKEKDEKEKDKDKDNKPVPIIPNQPPNNTVPGQAYDRTVKK